MYLLIQKSYFKCGLIELGDILVFESFYMVIRYMNWTGIICQSNFLLQSFIRTKFYYTHFSIIWQFSWPVTHDRFYNKCFFLRQYCRDLYLCCYLLIWTCASDHCHAGRSNDDLVLVSWPRQPDFYLKCPGISLSLWSHVLYKGFRGLWRENSPTASQISTISYSWDTFFFNHNHPSF